MKSIQRGFTMIELIVVIVILGVLAAVAVPRFVNVGTEAKAAALSGVTGAAASAMALNYAACMATATAASAAPTGKCVVVSNCTDASSLMQGGLPSGYTVGSVVLSASVNGTEGTCTVTQTATSNTATFTGVSAGH